MKIHEQFRKFLIDMANQFDLVMITDYMLESLVLLRYDLCMTLDDICFFSQNVRITEGTIRDKTKTRIKTWQHLDIKLYAHFNRTFWAKVETFGYEKMEREKNALRHKLQEYSDTCLGELA